MTTPSTTKPAPTNGAETFGGLLRAGETPEDALRRLERRKDYTKVIGSDDGQRLLEAATAQTKAIPNGGVKPKRARRVVDPEKTPDEELAERSEAVAGFRANLVDLGFVVAETPQPGDRLESIPLELVDVGDNVRMDPGELEAFAASIRELGVLQPVKATQQPDGRYLLRWGQRRVLAAREAGLTEIPAIVAGGPEPGAGARAIEQLVENLDRKDLNPLEEANALRAVLDADPELTQQALAERLGRSPSWLSNSLRLLGTADVVQDGLRKGTISASHAKALAALPPADQPGIARRIELGQLSAHELEREVGWKLDEVKRRERVADRSAKAGPKAIAALEAASVAKDVAVIVRAYNLDTPPIAKAIKAAGWTISDKGYASRRPEKGKCDCKVVTLEFSRSWTVEPGCVNDRHLDRQVNADHVEQKKRRDAIAGRVHVLHERIVAELKARPMHPMILRLTFRRHSHRWTWADLLAAPDDQVVDELADVLAGVLDPTYVYPPSDTPAAEQALEDAIAALGGIPPVVQLPAPAAPVAEGQVEAFDDVDVKPAGPVNVDELRGEAERSVES